MKKLALKLTLPLMLVLGSALYLGLAAANFAFNPTPVEASTAPSNAYARKDLSSGDWAWNWDFKGTTQRSSNVDWGMRYIFKNNASVNNVKDRLDGRRGDPNITPTWGWVGSAKWANIHDGPGRRGRGQTNHWDSDRGIKDYASCRWNHMHIRFYANGNRNYNSRLGYYVIASSHRDHEGGGRSCDYKFSSTEFHEDIINSRVTRNLGPSTSYGWRVFDNAFSWGNAVRGVIDIGGGNHKYQSDGRGPVYDVTGR